MTDNAEQNAVPPVKPAKAKKKKKRRPAPKPKVVAIALPEQPARILEDPMQVLAQIALQEQADKASERQTKRVSRERALAMLHADETRDQQNKERFQAVCDHLLGNHRLGVIPDRKFCALHKDYLSDKSSRIYCGKCRFEWKPGDTSKFIRRGYGDEQLKQFRILPNPTKKSWAQISEFFYSFSNSQDLTSKSFRLEKVEAETIETEEARMKQWQKEYENQQIGA